MVFLTQEGSEADSADTDSEDESLDEFKETHKALLSKMDETLKSVLAKNDEVQQE